MEKLINFDDLITISSDDKILNGRLVIPEESQAIIVFVDDLGHVLHNKTALQLADYMQQEGFATLLVDLLTKEETLTSTQDLDINHIAHRVSDVRNWIAENPQTEYMNTGFFNMNTGTAAVIKALNKPDSSINALVSLAGRPDLAQDSLKNINTPVLYLAGDADNANVTFHEKALSNFNSFSKLEVIADGGGDFLSPPILQKVALLSKEWFIRHL